MSTSGPFRVPRSRAHMTHDVLRAEILAALEPVLFGPMVLTSEVRATLEQRFAAAVGQRHACAVHSGTIGLVLALRACGIGPGDEVITVANSDISTTGAISLCGATPVLCDVQATDYTIDVALVESLITSRTHAILPVDLHGHPANVRALRVLADRHGLRIVEDAALAAGARDHGVPLGAFADAAVFSFAPFKPLGSVGNGAMVTTNDPAVAEQLALLSKYGHARDTTDRAPGEQWYIAEGYNVPLDPLQAALLTVKLPYLEQWTARRRAIAAFYTAGLRDVVGVPAFRPESQPTFRSFAILAPDQRAFHHDLRERGIEVVLHYTPPIHHHPVYKPGLRHSDSRTAHLPIFVAGLPGADRLPVTERLAAQVVCLPVTPELTDTECEFVVDTVRELVKSRILQEEQHV